MTTNKTFSQLRRNSGSFEAIQKKLADATGKKKDYKDDRFWFASQDKAGNAQAIIRFLPNHIEEDTPFVKLHSHSFQGPGGQWLIENCPTTVGGQCPICEANGVLWNSGFDDDKKTVSARKRKLHFIANVLIVSDPANPENEGKVFLFKFGKKIFDKINSVMNPEFDDETPINPFNYWTGANFKLKIVKKDGFANYDKSAFDRQTELFDGDEEKLEELDKKIHKINEFVSKEQFKTYDELKQRHDKILGVSTGKPKTIDDDLEESKFERKSLTIEDTEIDSLSEKLTFEDDDLSELEKLLSDD